MQNSFKILFVTLSSLLLISSISCQNSNSDSPKKPIKSNTGDPNKPNSNNDRGGNGSGSNGDNGRPAAPVTCEDAWNQMIQHNALGRFEKLENKSYSVQNNKKNLSSTTLNSKKVTANNGQAITWNTLIETTFPNKSQHESNYTLTKDEFMQNCNKGTNPDPNRESEYEFIQLGDEQVTVTAGTFTCLHMQMKPKNANPSQEMFIETWTAKDQPELLVKSFQNIKITNGEMNFEQFTETQLIEFHN